METIIKYIMEYGSIFGPALASTIGVIIIFIKGFKTIKDVVKDIKDEESIKKLKSELEIANMRYVLVVNELKELRESITKVHVERLEESNHEKEKENL